MRCPDPKHAHQFKTIFLSQSRNRAKQKQKQKQQQPQSIACYHLQIKTMSTAKMNNKSLPRENEQIVESEVNAHHVGCGILGKYPVLSVLIFAATGLLVGIGMSTWKPEDSSDKDVAVKWIGLIGDMFIRALKAIVLPLVFGNVILSMIEMMSVGRASAVGGKTVLLYLVTTFVASIIGIISILCFKGLFKTDFVEPNVESKIMFGCGGEEGSYLTHDTIGSVFCTAANLTDDMSNFFTIEDVDNTFVKSQTGVADLTFSETMYDGVFVKMIPSNIFVEFVNSNFAGVVVFAICLGAALSRCLYKTGKNPADSVLVNFLKEVDDVLITLIHWVISITPFAVFSLIAR
jgi:Na+/H+-dicarboxylate symporter